MSRRKSKVPYKPLKIGRLFREWYAFKEKGFSEMKKMWIERGEPQEEIDKAGQDLADIFNGQWIKVEKKS